MNRKWKEATKKYSRVECLCKWNCVSDFWLLFILDLFACRDLLPTIAWFDCDFTNVSHLHSWMCQVWMLMTKRWHSPFPENRDLTFGLSLHSCWRWGVGGCSLSSNYTDGNISVNRHLGWKNLYMIFWSESVSSKGAFFCHVVRTVF